MYPFRSYFYIWHLPRLSFNRVNMYAKVQILFWNEEGKRKKVIFKKKKNGFIYRKQRTSETETGDGRNKNSRLATGRTVGCLSQTANENRFARFLNNRQNFRKFCPTRPERAEAPEARRPVRAEAPSPGHRPGYNSSQQGALFYSNWASFERIF